MLLFFIFLSFEQIPYVKKGPFSEEIELEAGNYMIQCYGAQGGKGYEKDVEMIYNSQGGKGAYVYGKIKLTEKTTIYVNVGGQGKSEIDKISEGGSNGGGKSIDSKGPYFASGGGGGATDIRLGDNSTSKRILVAAGGSGAVGRFEGAPGGDDVGRFFNHKKDGYQYTFFLDRSSKTTQTLGGENGQGQNGFHEYGTKYKFASSGGGGGWRGGIARKSQNHAESAPYSVADSGSSFISGFLGCSTNQNTEFYDGGWTVGEHEGEGLIKISFFIKCPEHCAACADSETCAECEYGYILYGGRCHTECPPGTRQNGDGCEECRAHCMKCSTSPETCDVCDNQTFIYNNECYENCSSIEDDHSHFGANEENRRCERCIDEHCTNCSSNYEKCEACAPPFILDETTNKCFSPTDAFSNSNKFSSSVSFSKSSDFSRSLVFSSTFIFSETIQFTRSSDFSKSSFFSKSHDFTKTSDFTKSSGFSNTQSFSKSSRFSNSYAFTKSSAFAPSDRFSKSSQFSKSSAFEPSSRFSRSEEFSRSSLFSKFSSSISFSKSSYFTDSFEFSRSYIFSSSFILSKSSHFSETSVFSKTFSFSLSGNFSKSSDFTKSFLFDATSIFSNSFVFSKSSDFINSFISQELSVPVLMQTSEFTKSEYFTDLRKNSFSEFVTKFSISIFHSSNEFPYSNDFQSSISIYSTNSLDFDDLNKKTSSFEYSISEKEISSFSKSLFIQSKYFSSDKSQSITDIYTKCTSLQFFTREISCTCSQYFTKSLDFEYSNEFKQSNEFSKSQMFNKQSFSQKEANLNTNPYKNTNMKNASIDVDGEYEKSNFIKSFWWLFVVIAGLLGIIVFIIFILIYKKKQDEEEEEEEEEEGKESDNKYTNIYRESMNMNNYFDQDDERDINFFIC